MKSLRKNEKKLVSDETMAAKPDKRESTGGKSLIGYLLDKLSTAMYNALVGGFFGCIFSSYDSQLSAYQNGFIFHNFKSGSKVRIFLRKLRGYLSQSVETSFALRKLRKAVSSRADVSVKSYGRFLLSFGIYILLFFFIKLFVPAVGTANYDHLYLGIIISVLSVPFLTSNKTLAQAAYGSKITKFIFSDAFGFREESFEQRPEANTSHSSTKPLFYGLVLGALTFFVHPAIIIAVIIFLTTTAFIIISPEIGILLALFAIPFLSIFEYPALLLTLLILTTAISFLIKLIRGKRVIRFEIIDFFVLLFLAILYFSGRITVGGYQSYLSALVVCLLMLGYFLIANLIRSGKWVLRCIYAIVFSGTVTAIIGVLQYVLGFAENDWLDRSYFADIYGRATATFDNPNYLATYLALVFPFALYLLLRAKGVRSRILSSVSCITLVLCIICTWCRAAWIAVIVCFVIYLMIITRKSFKYILAVAVATPVLAFFIPNNVIERFLSIGNLADSSTLYRVYIWKGSLNMIKDNIWGGIGYGQQAFEHIYPEYAFAGIEGAVHSHNLYLQILIGTGIGGLICFALAIFFFAQNSLTYMRSPHSRDSSLITSAALMSVLTMLIMGLFDFVWYNNSMFFMFWAVMALGVACTRIGRRELERDACIGEFDNSRASINFEL